MFSRRFSVPLLLVLLSACAIKKPAGPSALETDYQLKMEDANSSFDKGCFVCLTDAFEIYQGLLSHPLDRGTAQQKLFQTSLLLALREKELDIQNERYEDEAERWIPDPPSSDSLLALEIVEATSSSSSGFSDERLEEHFKGLRRLREIAGSDKLVSSLKQQADAEWFGAYIYFSLMNALNASKGDDIGPEIDSLAEAHRASPPVLYKYAISTGSDRTLLEKVLQLEPSFHEAHFYLGQTALKEGDLYGGEAHLAEAHSHFSDSLTIVTLLAETILEIGESEKSLEYYEKALSLVPTHRYALLGKAKCLSFLGRNDDAIQVLQGMIALGKWYLGDAHYWLAWNEHELGQMDEAVSTIEKAKTYLPMDTEVFTLSGIMAFEQDRLDHALLELEKAKRFDIHKSNCEAPFHLGMIYSRQEHWESSGVNFERAGQCHSNEVRGLEALIFSIQASSLSVERKQRLILLRETQREKAALNEATAFYNAAAGYFNAGMGERAWNCAISASQHDYFKDKANDLIVKIQETIKH